MPIYEEKEKVDGQKRFYIRTYITDEFGKRKQITKHNKEWIGRDGYWLAHQEENVLKNKKNTILNKIKVNDVVLEKLNEDKKYLKQSSIIRYNEIFNIYIKPYFENVNCDSITSKNILDWHNKIDEKRISITTKKKIHNLLKSSLDYAMKFYNLEKNVCTIVGNFKDRKCQPKNKIEFLTYKEFKLFIANEENENYMNFFKVLFFTGMRRGELFALTKDDIDFKNNIIHINKSINPKNGLEATLPKTSKSNRDIPMLNNIRDTLKSVCDKVDKNLFPMEEITTSTLCRKCNSNIKNANIKKHIRIHDFRHSFVSLCINSGVRIEKISEYVGHENISTTYDVYGHLYPTAKLELVEKVDMFLKEQDQKQDQ